jgi:hypothetical protein
MITIAAIDSWLSEEGGSTIATRFRFEEFHTHPVDRVASENIRTNYLFVSCNGLNATERLINLVTTTVLLRRPFWQKEAKIVRDFNAGPSPELSSSTRTAVAPECDYASANDQKSPGSAPFLGSDRRNEPNRGRHPSKHRIQTSAGLGSLTQRSKAFPTAVALRATGKRRSLRR